MTKEEKGKEFQSSFELTGYITDSYVFQQKDLLQFQSSFELTGYITTKATNLDLIWPAGFKALSSLRVI